MEILMDKSFTASFDIDINDDLFSELIGANCKTGWELWYEKKVQRRRHRKRRINKKWAKRYGYRNVITKIDVEDFNVSKNSQDVNQISFIGTINHD